MSNEIEQFLYCSIFLFFPAQPPRAPRLCREHFCDQIHRGNAENAESVPKKSRRAQRCPTYGMKPIAVQLGN